MIITHNSDGDNEKHNLFTFLQTACYPPLDLFCQLFRCSPKNTDSSQKQNITNKTSTQNGTFS